MTWSSSKRVRKTKIYLCVGMMGTKANKDVENQNQELKEK